MVEGIRARLVALIRSRLGEVLRRETEAEDVLQETLLQAFRSIDRLKLKDADAFVRWLGAIAEHVILDLARKRPAQQVSFEREPPGESVSASRTLRRDERFDRLEEALKGLSSDHRQVILLARIEGLPVKEIARRMSRSPKAVTQLLMRALKQLRDTFGDTESLHLPPRSLSSGNDTNHG